MRLRSECSAERPWLEGYLAGRGPGAACIVCMLGRCLGHVGMSLPTGNRGSRSRSSGYARSCGCRGCPDGADPSGMSGVSAGHRARWLLLPLAGCSPRFKMGPIRPRIPVAFATRSPNSVGSRRRHKEQERKQTQAQKQAQAQKPWRSTPFHRTDAGTPPDGVAGYPSRISRARAYFSRRCASWSSETSGQPA